MNKRLVLVFMLVIVTGCASHQINPDPPEIVLPATGVVPPNPIPSAWIAKGQCVSFYKGNIQTEICYEKIRKGFDLLTISMDNENAILATTHVGCKGIICVEIAYGLRRNFIGRIPYPAQGTAWWLGIVAPPGWKLKED